jgi:hypothetical protein
MSLSYGSSKVHIFDRNGERKHVNFGVSNHEEIRYFIKIALFEENLFKFC